MFSTDSSLESSFKEPLFSTSVGKVRSIFKSTGVSVIGSTFGSSFGKTISLLNNGSLFIGETSTSGITVSFVSTVFSSLIVLPKASLSSLLLSSFNPSRVSFILWSSSSCAFFKYSLSHTLIAASIVDIFFSYSSIVELTFSLYCFFVSSVFVFASIISFNSFSSLSIFSLIEVISAFISSISSAIFLISSVDASWVNLSLNESSFSFISVFLSDNFAFSFVSSSILSESSFDTVSSSFKYSFNFSFSSFSANSSISMISSITHAPLILTISIPIYVSNVNEI